MSEGQRAKHGLESCGSISFSSGLQSEKVCAFEDETPGAFVETKYGRAAQLVSQY